MIKSKKDRKENQYHIANKQIIHTERVRFIFFTKTHSSQMRAIMRRQIKKCTRFDIIMQLFSPSHVGPFEEDRTMFCTASHN